MADINELMDKAIAADKIIGSGIPTQVVEALDETDASDLLAVFPGLLDKAPQVMDKVLPELETVSVDDLVEFMPKLMGMNEKMQDLDPSDLEEILPKMAENIPKIMPTMMTLMDKIISSDEELAEELEGAEDMAINVKAGDVMTICMAIKDGKMSMGTELADDADMTMDIPMDIMLNLMTGTGDAMSAFMGGDVKMDGDMSKAMGLMPLMTVFSEKFGIEMM